MKIRVNLKKAFIWFNQPKSKDALENIALKAQQNSSSRIETIEVTIEDIVPPESADVILKPRLLKEAYFEKIKREDVDEKYLEKVQRNLLAFLRSPEKVASNLQYVDEEIATRMQTLGIVFDEGEIPQYLVLGDRCYMPGRPSDENYVPKQKNRMIGNTLLFFERKYGLNLEEEGVFRFIGSVKGKDTVESLTSGTGHTFNEDSQDILFSSHGKFTHRLQLLAIFHAIEYGDLDLSVGGVNPSPRAVMNLLLKTSPNIWGLVLDNIETEDIDTKKPLSLSPTDPFAFNSLITCFGKELGLPHLQSAMLDSYYKSMGVMIDKVKSNSKEDLNPWDIYDVMMFNLKEYRDLKPFLPEDTETLQDPKYTPTQWPNIFTKEPPNPSKEPHTSMESYVRNKKMARSERIGQKQNKSSIIAEIINQKPKEPTTNKL